MQIANNLLSLSTAYQQNKNRLQDSMMRLASGNKTAVPGKVGGDVLTISESFKSFLSSGKSSLDNTQLGINLLYTAETMADPVYQTLIKMQQTAAEALANPTTTNLNLMNLDFQNLKDDLRTLSEQTYLDNPLIGKEAISAYDTSTNTLKFWKKDGSESYEISINLASETGYDSQGNLIGFSSSRDYSVDSEGKYLYFIGAQEDGSGYSLKKLDILNNYLTTGVDVESSDKIYVDPNGSLYLNNDGDLLEINTDQMSVSPTAIVSDMKTSSNFVAYNDVVYYVNSSNSIVKYDINASSILGTINPLGTGGGGDITYQAGTVASYASVNSTNFGNTSQTFSASGTYAADILSNGNIRIINLKTSVGEVISAPSVTASTALQFSKDGSQLFYKDSSSNSIKAININYDYENQKIETTSIGTVIQGKGASLEGLSISGSNPKSYYRFSTMSGDQPVNHTYQTIDLGVFALGISDTSINSISNAQSALEDIQDALLKTASGQVLLRMQSSRLNFIHTGNQNLISQLEDGYNQMTQIDIAKETAESAALQTQLQGSIAMLSQAKQMARNVLTLLDN